jgi:hypothetical protein
VKRGCRRQPANAIRTTGWCPCWGHGHLFGHRPVIADLSSSINPGNTPVFLGGAGVHVYILIGLTIIFILNVLRMSYLTWYGRSGLVVTDKNLSFFGIFKFDHHELFNFFIYIVIFALFILWVEVFGKKYSRPI